MCVEQRMTLDLRRKVFGQIMGRSLEFFNQQIEKKFVAGHP